MYVYLIYDHKIVLAFFWVSGKKMLSTPVHLFNGHALNSGENIFLTIPTTILMRNVFQMHHCIWSMVVQKKKRTLSYMLNKGLDKVAK